jgi:voltage-gated potassium channel
LAIRKKVIEFSKLWERQTSLMFGLAGLLYLAAYACQVIFVSDVTSRTFWNGISNTIWVLFLVDFLIRLIGTEVLKDVFRIFWFDIVCLIFPTIRFLRAFRAVLAARMVSKYFTTRTHRAGVFLATFVPLIWFGAAIAVMDAEASETGSSLKELPNALWWSISTISTIGYGQFPESIEGRIITVLLMLTGIGLFSAAAGLLAGWILRDPNSSAKST